MEKENNKIGYKDILKQKNYMKDMIASLINRFGDSIDAIALTWLVYQITGSAAWSTIIFGVNRIPTIFLQPFAGAMVEGRNKKKVMVITDIIRGFCVALIAISMTMDFVNEWMILSMTLIISTAEAFRGPASTALLPKIIDKKYYEYGISLRSSLNSVMELISIGVAGIIISQFGIVTAIYTDAVTFFLSAFIIMTMNVREEKQEKKKVEILTYLNDVKDGFIYIKGKGSMMYYVLLAVFLNAILVPLNSLQAPLINEILYASEYMLSVIGISVSLGMIVGSAIYPLINNKLSKRIIIMLGGYSIPFYYIVLVFAGILKGQTFLQYTIVSLGSFVLIGVCVSLMMALVQVEFVKQIDENYLARVGALFNSICVSAIPIVSFLITPLAKILSTRVLFIISGICGILICLIFGSKKRTKEL